MSKKSPSNIFSDTFNTSVIRLWYNTRAKKERSAFSSSTYRNTQTNNPKKKGGEHYMTKLYVGNLPYSTTEDELKNLFSEYGNVLSATLITDRDSGRSKGFGFIELEDDAKAQEAVTALDKSAMGDRTIFVSVARPREERPQGGGFGGGRGGGGFDRRGGRDDRRGGDRGGWDRN